MNATTTVAPRPFTSSGDPKPIKLDGEKKNNRGELPPLSVGDPPRNPRVETFLRELARAQRLQYYLREMTQTGNLSQSTATLAWKAWKELSSTMLDNLPVPDACPGPDGQLLYAWDKGEHHFELEIFPDGSGEFFYMNRQTDAVWEHDHMIGDSIPDGVKGKLRIFGLYGG